MLITLRNSGATGIQFEKSIDDELKLKLLANKDYDKIQGYFLNAINLDSVVIDKNKIDVKSLYITIPDRYGSNRFDIYILTDIGSYRLYYNSSTERPDFFKVLFKYFYPEQAEIQVEELV